MTRRLPIIAFGVLLMLLGAVSAHGHKMRVFAYGDGGMISGEAAFSGGRMAKGIDIIVEERVSGEQILVTKTGEDGTFSFAIPEIARTGRLDLRIVGDGGDGHRGEWLLAAADYLAIDAQESSPRPEKPADSISVKQPDRAERPVAACDEEMVKAIVDESLTRQLAPIRRSLAEQSEQRVSIQDILGGFGYLIGLAGIAAYFRAKRNQGGTDDV